MALQTLYSTKKTFYYNFFPTKAEEEHLKARKDEVQIPHDRILLEIRDMYQPGVVDLENPWLIKKTLSQYETVFGKLILSFNDTFEHVLRYWTLGMANYIALGQRVGVAVWDVTEGENPRKYQNNYGFYLQMMVNNDCFLSCLELIKDRGLKADDEICLYWDIKESSFMFKVVV
ncbi:hypothetical protein PHJA_000046600 [Phtheirospermum japonicum]|uniref:Uncharacterized protein n=1 Tax=Phtheirospermum japonicum TaxID=374723 RepID=A0A830BAH3_9LAMI|nr:hypothetical protein PHJA_000046600 [Phtheirospermum japonicum]